MSDRSRVVYLVGPEQLEVREVGPVAPSEGEVVVKIQAATTCGTDVKVWRRGGHPRMLVVPGPFGHEMSGVLEAVGRGVVGWHEGEEVVIANSASCGECAACGEHRENLCADLKYLNGAYGDRVVVPARFVRRSLYRRPRGLAAAVAALAEPLACVVHGIELCGPIEPTEVVVIGGGPIGLLFVNVLSHEGHHVVLADPNPDRLDAAVRMGASATVQVDRSGSSAEMVRGLASRGGFALAIEATGFPEAWMTAFATVRPGGTALLFGGCAPGTTVPLDTHRIHYSEITVRGGYHHRPATFARAIELLGDGRIATEVILDGERPIDEVGEALESMVRKEAIKVVIRP